MFPSKTAIVHTDLESQAGARDEECCQIGRRKPAHFPRTRINRAVRAALVAVGLLAGANVISLQMVSPAFAKSAKAKAAAAAAAAEAEAAEAATKEENQRNSYEKRKANVRALLDSGRKFDSENHTTHPEFDTAESMLKEAEALAAAKKYADGKEQLDRAYTLLKNTMRDVLKLKDVSASAKGSAAAAPKPAPAPPSDEKKKSDYETLARIIQALTTALKRESEAAGVNNGETFATVEANTKEAERLAKSGAYDQAYQALDAGYHILTKAIVKLEGLKNKGKADNAVSAKPDAGPSEPKQYVAREIETNKTLVAMLKHLNEDKGGGKEKEIEASKAVAAEASNALAAGDIALARNLIEDANSRTRKAIASLQGATDNLSANAAAESAHHPKEEAAKVESLRDAYARHRASVVVLLEAGKRVDGERHTSHPEFAKAEAMLAEADKLAAANKFDSGNEQLDRTYVLIKNTMRSMLSNKDEPKEAAAKQKKAAH